MFIGRPNPTKTPLISQKLLISSFLLYIEEVSGRGRVRIEIGVKRRGGLLTAIPLIPIDPIYCRIFLGD